MSAILDRIIPREGEVSSVLGVLLSPAVLAVLGTVLPSIFNNVPCLRDRTPAERQAAIVKQYNSGKGARRRVVADTGRKIRRSVKARGEFMSQADSLVVAEKSIQELAVATPEEVAELGAMQVATVETDCE
jgi:hypothetical protein